MAFMIMFGDEERSHVLPEITLASLRQFINQRRDVRHLDTSLCVLVAPTTFKRHDAVGAMIDAKDPHAAMVSIGFFFAFMMLGNDA